VIEHLGKAIAMEAFFQKSRAAVFVEDSPTGRMLWWCGMGVAIRAIIDLLKDIMR